jgi:hypothetical protein
LGFVIWIFKFSRFRVFKLSCFRDGSLSLAGQIDFPSFGLESFTPTLHKNVSTGIADMLEMVAFSGQMLDA